MAHEQLPLTTPAEKLKRGCICVFGTRRCSWKRIKQPANIDYDTLLDSITYGYQELNRTERDTTVQEFAKLSLCATCTKNGKAPLVEAAFFEEFRDTASSPEPPVLSTTAAQASTEREYDVLH